MTGTPVGYSRSLFTWRNEMSRPLTDDDARSMLGTELIVSLGGAALSKGTVTGARVAGDGSHLHVTIESGGRYCPACNNVYPTECADTALAVLDDLTEQTPDVLGRPGIYSDLPGWARVCRDAAACRHRRAVDG